MTKTNSRSNFIKKTSMVAAVAPFSLSAADFTEETKTFGKEKKRYAPVGTGTWGSSSWAKPIVDNYAQNAELVTLCYINHGSMAGPKIT